MREIKGQADYVAWIRHAIYLFIFSLFLFIKFNF